jgi:hypothetical protein
MYRRRFLRVAASAGALGALAGCTQRRGSNNSSNDDPGSSGETTPGTANDQVTSTTATATADETTEGTATDEPGGPGTPATPTGTPMSRTGTRDGVEYSIGVTAAECASGSQVNTVDDIVFEEDASEIVVTGTIDAATPCKAVDVSAIDHDASGGSVTVTIATVEREDGPDMCTQCLGALDYEATLTFGEELPSEASVVHDGQSGRRSMASAAYGSASATARPPRSPTPTTTDR